jgi:hypothetical protein
MYTLAGFDITTYHHPSPLDHVHLHNLTIMTHLPSSLRYVLVYSEFVPWSSAIFIFCDCEAEFRNRHKINFVEKTHT